MTMLGVNARMYALTPKAALAWEKLFSWISAKANLELTLVVHPPPLPLEELWGRRDLAAAFMCGFPFAKSNPRPKLIAAPLPEGSRYGGQPIYFTDLVTRSEAPFEKIEDTFGHRIGWTVDHSHSGFNALRHHLLPYAIARGAPLFAQSIGPLITPRRVVEALLKDEIDIGPLDSYALDLLRRHEPALVAQLKSVETTQAAPIPPLIATANLTDQELTRLREAFLNVADAPSLEKEREMLCLSGFVLPKESDYALALQWEQAAQAAGYDIIR